MTPDAELMSDDSVPPEFDPTTVPIVDTIEVIPVVTDELVPLHDPDADQKAGFQIEDGFSFAYAEYGDILQDVPDGSVLTGTTAGDIFLLWDGEQKDITVQAGPGGDIALAWGGSGHLNMGSGGDIADLWNWTGVLNLGNDLDSDVFLFTPGEANLDHMIKVTNFDPLFDTFVAMVEFEERDTDAGRVYAWEGQDVLLIQGYHPEDWIV